MEDLNARRADIAVSGSVGGSTHGQRRWPSPTVRRRPYPRALPRSSEPPSNGMHACREAPTSIGLSGRSNQ